MQNIIEFGQKYPIFVILFIIAGLTLSILFLPNLRIDSSSRSMMMASDPEVEYYQETIKLFGSDSLLIVYIKDKNLFTSGKLIILEKLVNKLNDGKLVPGVQRVESLFSVSNLRGSAGMIDNTPLMDYPPETDSAAKAILEKALHNPVLSGNLLSSDGKTTVINLYLKPAVTDDQNSEAATANGVSTVLKSKINEADPDSKTFIEAFDKVFEIGGPYVRDTLTSMISDDMFILIPLSFIVLMIMLIITMGSLHSAIIPFITSIISILFTLGFMGACDIPFNILTFIVPALVIVIGSTEDVHILSEYSAGLIREGNRKLAITFMARTIGTSVFLTALTTFLGFLSIALNKVIVLIQFGLLAGFALFINPLITFLLTPVYLRFFGKKTIKKNDKKPGFIIRALNKIADTLLILIKQHKKIIFILFIGSALIIGIFSVFINVDNDTISYFKDDSELIQRMQTMHDELSGAQTFFIRIEQKEAALKGDRNNIWETTRDGDSIGDNIIDDTSSDNQDDSSGDDIIIIDDTLSETDLDDSSEDDSIIIDDTLSEYRNDSSGDEIIIIDDTSEETSGDGEINMGDTFSEPVYSPEKDDPWRDDTRKKAKLFQDPRYMRIIDDIQRKLDTEYDFDKTISIANYIRIIHKELNVDKSGNFDTTPDPDDPSSTYLIAQYAQLLHYDEISAYITSDWNRANILVRHNITSSEAIGKVVQQLNRDIKAIIYDRDPYLTFAITGENILYNKAADSIATSQVSSLGLLLLTILIIMSILFTNIKAGLLALVPNLIPVAILFGIMGIFAIPLNIGTCMVAAVAIGISVDDTIHFMTRFNKEMREFQHRDMAIGVVMRAELRPVLSTSIALALGFLILSQSSLIPVIYFGILTSIVMICALLADLLITPVLLTSFQLINLSDIARLKLANELKDSTLFTGMSMYEIKKFILMGKIVHRQTGEHVIKSGDSDQKMYILLSGKVNVQRKNMKTGDILFLDSFGIGDVFGEISLLRKAPRSADIVAEEPISYLEIDWEGFLRIRRSSRSISVKLYLNLARILSLRLVHTTDLLQKSELS